ncbi:MAG: CAP domain-containing protein [Deltaproteobacteria bacterium]|nr:CAP domain-containing protein [Deltaproteobacteria bacterium]
MLGMIWILALVPATSDAAQQRGIVVTPLGDDGVGTQPSPTPGEDGLLPGQSGTGGQARTEHGDGIAAGDLGASSPDGAAASLPDEPPSYKDGIVMAYLVELMRKQGRPCPSGATPPVPPSLLFSEPLCRVAESVGKGVPFPAAYEEQGLYASRWRMFSAADQPAQTVATRLRAEHCEALLEPHTHIGAWHGPGGWRIVLATLAEKPPVDAGTGNAAVPPAENAEDAPTGGAGSSPAVHPAPTGAPGRVSVAGGPVAAPAEGRAEPAPGPGTSAASQDAPRPGLPPLAAMAPGIPSDTAPPSVSPSPAESARAEPYAVTVGEGAASPPAFSPPPPPASGDPATGQEARALFRLMNDLRAKGGSCLGKPARTAPPLAFNPGLQAAAEKEAAAAAAQGGFGTILGASPDTVGGTVYYPGARMTKLTATSRPPASVVLDVWMVSPTRCETLLSPDYQDAGAAYSDGYWVVLLGQRVPPASSPNSPVR